jgi:hypothetical protein
VTAIVLTPAQVTFLYGVLGSVAVEVIKLLAYYEGGGHLPLRYKRWGFWVVRILLALIGGALAVAYGIKSELVAVHVGASTPAIIGTFAKQPPER